MRLKTRCRVSRGTAADRMGTSWSGRKNARRRNTGHPSLPGQHPTPANLAVNGPELWRPRDCGTGQARREPELRGSAPCPGSRACSENALRAASGAFVMPSTRAPPPAPLLSAQSRPGQHGGWRSAAAGCGRGCSSGCDGPRHAAGRDPVRSAPGVPREGHPGSGGEEAAPVYQRKDAEGDRWAPGGPPRTWRRGLGSPGWAGECGQGGRAGGAAGGVERGGACGTDSHSCMCFCVRFLPGLVRFYG